MVLEKNVFVERILPASVQRTLGRRRDGGLPASVPASRGVAPAPRSMWPREIPVGGEPADVVAIVDRYSRWLAAQSYALKLFINADPGSILVGAQREFCRRWPHQQEVTVRGLHFIQEDSPGEVGRAIAEFLARRP